MPLPLIGLGASMLLPAAIRGGVKLFGAMAGRAGAKYAARGAATAGMRGMAYRGAARGLGAVARRPGTSLAVMGGAGLAGAAYGARGLAGAAGFGRGGGFRGALGPGGGPGAGIAYTWSTGTAEFARLTDGRIAVQRRDGTVKTYRPYHPVVIPRKWNARSMGRVRRALKSHRKTAQAIIRLTGGSTTQRRPQVSVSGKDVVQIKQ